MRRGLAGKIDSRPEDMSPILCTCTVSGFLFLQFGVELKIVFCATYFKEKMVGTSNTRTFADEEAARQRRQPHKRQRQADGQIIRHAFAELAVDEGPEIVTDEENDFPEPSDGPDHMSQIM